MSSWFKEVPTKEQKKVFEKKLRGLAVEELKVGVDRSIIQKGVLDSVLALLGQINIDDVSDINLTTSNSCGCFAVNLSVEFKTAEE